MTKYPLVRIIWWDAEDAKDTWCEIDIAEAYADTPCEITSYGYLVRRTRAYTVLAGDQAVNSSGHLTFGRVTKIPTPWIRSVRRLRG